jgi:glycosyltransferase involved in cell wall biosynthesis
MKNILHVIESWGPGGAETVLINIVSGLDKKEFQSHVVLLQKDWLYNQLTQIGIVSTIIKSRGSFDLNFLLRLAWLIKKNKIDIVHSHLFGANVYCSLVGLILRVPVISTFHGYVDANKNDKLLNIKFKIIRAGSRKLVFVSNHLKDLFLTMMNIDHRQALVIYNGVDIERFKPKKNNLLREELGVKENDFLIGCIGNIRSAKGYDILLQAVAKIRDIREDCKFVIAGKGSGLLYHDLMKLWKKLKLQHTVFFLGFRDDPEFLLNNFDIFLLPSTSEGFSISTIEAMACKKPVIATKSGGPEEIINHNQNGMLIAPGKPEAIIGTLFDLLGNGKKREQIAINAFKEMRGKFSNNTLVKNYEELYGEVNGSRV